jgi:hypothetical protein
VTKCNPEIHGSLPKLKIAVPFIYISVKDLSSPDTAGLLQLILQDKIWSTVIFFFNMYVAL